MQHDSNVHSRIHLVLLGAVLSLAVPAAACSVTDTSTEEPPSQTVPSTPATTAGVAPAPPAAVPATRAHATLLSPAHCSTEQRAATCSASVTSAVAA